VYPAHDSAAAEQLAALKESLESALGVTFDSRDGEHFFRSTLVQTLFYGVFAAWVLRHRQEENNPPPRAGEGAGKEHFGWRTAAYDLHVPMISALFEQLSQPSKLKALNLMDVLDWTADALNRVDRAAFFAKFQAEHSVQYFYEPFLEAFDPELRKQLGVWYAPWEIVRYHVARAGRRAGGGGNAGVVGQGQAGGVEPGRSKGNRCHRPPHRRAGVAAGSPRRQLPGRGRGNLGLAGPAVARMKRREIRDGRSRRHPGFRYASSGLRRLHLHRRNEADDRAVAYTVDTLFIHRGVSHAYDHIPLGQ
jgi:hypothetical protein